MTDTRPPAVAGRFYEHEATILEAQITEAFEHDIGPGEVPEATTGPPALKGLIAPHAGIPFSGAIAAHGYGALARSGVPEVAILVGPNHSGLGETVAVSNADGWRTPLGTVDVHGKISSAIVEETSVAYFDERTHADEHSLEVQLPFLQTIYDDPPAIVPVAMSRQNRSVVQDLGPAIATTIDRFDESIVVIGSTDLTHYKPQDVARRLDEHVIEEIEALDPDGLLQAVEEHSLSMCGYGPTAATMLATTHRGANDATVLQYATSADTGGDASSAVGYCAASIS